MLIKFVGVLNISFFISKRLLQHKTLVNDAKQQGFSLLIVRLAVAAVTISITVMLLAIAISKGYQKEVRNKLTGFNSHFQINNYDLNNSLQEQPVKRDTIFENALKNNSCIKHIQRVVTKPGIIKTETDFEGIVLKGIDESYDKTFIKQYLVEGDMPDFGKKKEPENKIVISKITADKLGLTLNNDVLMYFIQEPPRVRKLKIVGIYNTGLSELDQLYAFTDLKITHRLNNFNTNEITAYEVYTNNFNKINEALNVLKYSAPPEYDIKTVYEVYAQMFDWLGLLDMNVFIIILLMIIVAAINMMTALLILIVERSNMIGILKALGSSNQQIQKIFLYISGNILVKGLILGNLLALLLVLFQYYTGAVKLNAADYYLDRVPISISIIDVMLVNIAAFALCLLTLLLPVKIINKLLPVKTIKFN